MANTSIILESTSATGKKLRKAITDVNSEATNAQLKSFAQQLNALSTNTYGSTARVTKDACKAASELTALNITELFSLYSQSKTVVTNNGTVSVDNEYLTGSNEYPAICCVIPNDYTGIPVITKIPTGAACRVDSAKMNAINGLELRAVFHFVLPPVAGDDLLGEVIIHFPETDTYAPFDFKFTIVAAE